MLKTFSLTGANALNIHKPVFRTKLQRSIENIKLRSIAERTSFFGFPASKICYYFEASEKDPSSNVRIASILRK